MTLSKPDFAVIGKPIAHSLSPQIHSLFAKQTGIVLKYEKILGDEENFERQVMEFFEQGGRGMNVTLPFKERACALAQSFGPLAEKAKAANTLLLRSGQLYADNTDGPGLIAALKPLIDIEGKTILILGAGGAARGILASLLACRPAHLVLTNRTLAKAEALQADFPELKLAAWEELEVQADLIINATAMSLSGVSVDLPASLWSSRPYCYDLAYDLHQPTAFLTLAREQGCEAEDGLGMLIEQAALAFYLWHGLQPQTQSIRAQLLKNS